MILRTGVDLVETARIAEAIERNGERFMKRIFTPAEVELSGGRLPSLSGRYAAKEAVSKAFATGIGDMRWVEIEILQDDRKAPQLVLHGNAAKIAAELGLTTWSISISHTESHAVGMAVALGEGL